MIEVRRATAREVRVSCVRYHYAHAVPLVSDAYSVFAGGAFCGTVCFGSGANYHIGEPYGLVQGQVLELVRVALNGQQGHGHTSEAVMAAVRRLHRDRPSVRLLVSYADESQGHAGKIYQATNWIYVGEYGAGDNCAFVIKGRRMHKKSVYSQWGKCSLPWLREHVDPEACEVRAAGKFKYLYPLDKRMRRKVMPLALPYPREASGTDEVMA